MTDHTPPDQGANPAFGTPNPGQPPTPGMQQPTEQEAFTPPPDVPDAVARTEQAFSGAEQAALKVTDAMNQATAPEIPDLGETTRGPGAESIGLLEDVQLQVRIELGRTRMLVEDVLRLGSGAVVELDKAAGDPVDIYVNGRRIARGEVLVLNENFCVRVSEIVDPQARTA
ncbi:MAG: flagellar motor switch protein FliN [Phycisphaerales bacterium]|nr:flagellar motor switch protein FliN [Phycisphaerales bacterium]